MRKFIPALFAAAILTACAQTPAPVVLPAIGFANGAPMRVDAPRIEIVESYHSPMRAPNVEHEFSQSPSALVKAWVRDRMVASGRGGEFRLVIKDASVVAEDLPLKGGIEGALTRQQAVNLKARIVVALEYTRKNGSDAMVTVTVAKSRTLAEGLSPIERDKANYAFIRDLGTDLDRELQQNMDASMRDALL